MVTLTSATTTRISSNKCKVSRTSSNNEESNMLTTSLRCKAFGPPGAEIMVVGEAPGDHELKSGMPFCGPSGIELTLMMGEAGLVRSQFYLTNVVQSRPPGGDVAYWIASTKTQEAELLARGGVRYNGRVISKELYEGILELRADFERVRPKLVIALGNAALWAFTGEWGIGNWRGSQLETNLSFKHICPCVPTYNPAAVLRQWNLRRIVVQDFRRIRAGLADGWPTPRYRFSVAPTYEQACDTLDFLERMLDSAAAPVRLSVDIETRNYHIACLGIAWSRQDAICIPFLDARHIDGYWSLAEESYLVHRLQVVLTHPRAAVVGQNFLYDAQYIQRYFCFVPRVARDTMLYQHLAFVGIPKSLDFIASMYCEYYRFWKEDGKTWSESMDERVLWKYNCEDCVRTYECDEALEGVVDKLGLTTQASFQMRLWWATFRMMVRGINVSDSIRSRLELEMNTHAQWLLEEIAYLAGQPLNPKSPKQMKEFFYGTLQLRPEYKRGKRAQPGKIRQPSCDDECLTRVAQREPLVAGLIRLVLEYRSVAVYASTFLRDCRDVDGLVRCSFNPAGTVTFRFSSSENAFGSGMNLQNLPGREKEIENGYEESEPTAALR